MNTFFRRNHGFNNSIRNIEYINEENLDTQKPTVFYCFDGSFDIYAAISASSLLDSVTNAEFNLVFFCFNFKAKIFEFFKSFDKSKHLGIAFVSIAEETVKDFYTSRNISSASYLRLIVPNYFLCEKAIYIDSDTIITGDINQLFDVDMQGFPIAAVKENDEIDNHKRLGLIHQNPYFNSGLILFDVSKWISETSTEKAFDLAWKSGPLLFHDQDILNLMFSGRVKLLDRQWNIRKAGVTNPYNGLGFDDIEGVVHFNGPVKPWMSWAKKQERDFYKRFANKIFIEDFWCVKEPKNTQELSLYALTLEHENRFEEANMQLKKLLNIYQRALTSK